MYADRTPKTHVPTDSIRLVSVSFSSCWKSNILGRKCSGNGSTRKRTSMKWIGANVYENIFNCFRSILNILASPIHGVC